jgi:trans-2,3-dihydro-3-hydroxyanthranilate isomerase
MTEAAFFFVDVFADRPLTGNPLTLVPDADHLDEARMRALAREFNQSETTFAVRPSLPGAHVRLRSFTPAGFEVGGAGHNALGAWIWLAVAGRLPSGDTLSLQQEIAGQLLPVEVIRRAGEPDVIWMDQSAPEFGATAEDRGELAACLSLDAGDLAAGRDARVVSTGAGHLLVPVRDRHAVDRARADTARLAGLLREAGGEGCYVYCEEPASADGAVAYSRFFNPTVGIAEDPATGTAAGPLAARLAAEGMIDDGATVVVLQGQALGRPSRIQVSVAGQRVRVGGSGLVVAEGTIRV